MQLVQNHVHETTTRFAHVILITKARNFWLKINIGAKHYNSRFMTHSLAQHNKKEYAGYNSAV